MLYSHTCGLISVFGVYLSYFFISYIGIKFGFYKIYEGPTVHIIIFLLLVGLSMICHISAMLTDPGTITDISIGLTSNGIPCIVCGCEKPPRAHHCNTCNKCIQNMDHHCPWINNCVGYRNQKHFILFLAYTLIICTWLLVTMVQRIIVCNRTQCIKPDNPYEILLIMLSCIWCLYCEIMVIVSLRDQIKVLKTNISHIDELQLRVFQKVVSM
jgi:DHHC palmitoyltransferase